MSSPLLGALAGTTLRLTGAGSGILATPLLKFGAGLPQPQATPTALVAISLAATLGAGQGPSECVVRYPAAPLVGSAEMLVAPGSVWLPHRAPAALATLALAAVTCLSALTMYRRSQGHQTASVAGAASTPCHWSSESGRARAPQCSHVPASPPER